MLNIALSSPFGHAHFDAPVGATAEFLHRTYRIVEGERESEFINVDGGLDELLWRA